MEKDRPVSAIAEVEVSKGGELLILLPKDFVEKVELKSGEEVVLKIGEEHASPLLGVV